VPSVFDTKVVEAVARAVQQAAIDEGVARRELLMPDDEAAQEPAGVR
jgi:malic enzyme